MPQKRTKEQKRKAQEKRIISVSTEPADQNADSKPVTTFSFVTKKANPDLPAVTVITSGVTQEHVKKDLIKTLVVTFVLGCILVGIYFRLGYN